MRNSKKLIILVIAIVATVYLAWVYTRNEPSSDYAFDDRQDTAQPSLIVEEKTEEISFDKQAGQTIRESNSPSAIYHNEKLGIELSFPSEFLEPWENWYKDSELFAITFKKTDSESIQLTPEESLRSCDDVMKNGFYDGDLFPSSCESMSVDGNVATIVSFSQGYKNAPSKEVYFALGERVWKLSTSEATLYDSLLDMARSAKSLP
jgi:hypothetical protein